jgi:hypothetical protein
MIEEIVDQVAEAARRHVAGDHTLPHYHYLGREGGPEGAACTSTSLTCHLSVLQGLTVDSVADVGFGFLGAPDIGIFRPAGGKLAVAFEGVVIPLDTFLRIAAVVLHAIAADDLDWTMAGR